MIYLAVTLFEYYVIVDHVIMKPDYYENKFQLFTQINTLVY